MNSLQEIKDQIYKTKCKEIVLDGLSISEPILTIGEKGLIDNYFMYSVNTASSTMSPPIYLFGIYSDIPEMAYCRKAEADPSFKHDQKVEPVPYSKELEEEYSALYMQVRSCAFGNVSDKQRQSLQEYLRVLQKISLVPLWNYYNSLFPEFFDWVEKETNGLRMV